LIREANKTADVKKRAEILAEAEAILIRDELPIVPLYLYVGMNFWDPTTISGVWNNSRDEHPIRTIVKSKPTHPLD
jgi:ABC-type oligopeptide transport system substrate-binding subunit